MTSASSWRARIKASQRILQMEAGQNSKLKIIAFEHNHSCSTKKRSRCQLMPHPEGLRTWTSPRTKSLKRRGGSLSLSPSTRKPSALMMATRWCHIAAEHSHSTKQGERHSSTTSLSTKTCKMKTARGRDQLFTKRSCSSKRQRRFRPMTNRYSKI